MSYIQQDSTLSDRVEGASIRESKMEEKELKMKEWREKQEKEFRIRVVENRKITSKIDYHAIGVNSIKLLIVHKR